MTRIDQSDLYRRNSAVFKNFVLYSPDPPSAFTEGLGTRLSLEVEQQDMVLITDCFTQLFSTSVDLEHLTIATVPLFRLIKTIFIAGYTRMCSLYTCGCVAGNPLPTFSSEIQSNQVTNFNVTMTLCTEDLEHVLAASVPVLPLYV